MCADCQCADNPAQMGGQSTTQLKNVQRLALSLVGLIVVGQTVRPRWADGPPL